jgi:hypothetical protein
MNRMRTVRCLGAAVTALAVAASCSKNTTAPGDPFAGSWTVSFGQVIYNNVPPDTGTISPNPFTLTLAKGGTGQAIYLATWPSLTWALTTNGTYVIPSSTQTLQTVTVSGNNTLMISIPGPAWLDSTCQIQVTGAYNGKSAQGSIHMVGGICGPSGNDLADGTWTATKQ